MRVAVTYSGCHRRGGVERVMLECVNFLAGRGHETHAIARRWDDGELASGVVKHDLSYNDKISSLALPAYRLSLIHI